MSHLIPSDFCLISKKLDALCDAGGFESHPFKIGWYNDAVGEKFSLSFDDDALAFVVISVPSMFEKTFLPFVKRSFDTVQEDFRQQCLRDPLDECMVNYFASVVEKLGNTFGPVSVLHDFELGANRRPKVLVQTAGHVSGAVRFYQKQDCPHLEESLGKNKIYPVCLHPKYGGWFALRGIVVFSECLVPDLVRRIPPSILGDSEIANLLVMYNCHWKDWRFRDVIRVEERYSDHQKTYFELPPGEERWKFLTKLLASQ